MVQQWDAWTRCIAWLVFCQLHWLLCPENRMMQCDACTHSTALLVLCQLHYLLHPENRMVQQWDACTYNCPVGSLSATLTSPPWKQNDATVRCLYIVLPSWFSVSYTNFSTLKTEWCNSEMLACTVLPCWSSVSTSDFSALKAKWCINEVLVHSWFSVSYTDFSALKAKCCINEMLVHSWFSVSYTDFSALKAKCSDNQTLVCGNCHWLLSAPDFSALKTKCCTMGCWYAGYLPAPLTSVP